jgi:oxygen-independent coproporphyrinogen-3 oxidase
VIYEEDTALYQQLSAGEFEVDEELACSMYEDLVSKTAEAGLEQYEVANFARCTPHADHRSAHNVNYWKGGTYYGLGPSASEFIDGLRTRNWSNTQLWCEQLEKGNRAIEAKDPLPPLKRAGEIAAFGLRMPEGWGFQEFRSVTGFDLRTEWKTEMEEAVRRGLAVCKADRFSLNAKGLRFADDVGSDFLK